jgi:hypothetical protein
VVLRGDQNEGETGRGTGENCTTRWDEIGELLHEIRGIGRKEGLRRGEEGDRMLELRRKGGNVSLIEGRQERRGGGGSRRGQDRKRRTGGKEVG